jgi:hypothetical protein
MKTAKPFDKEAETKLLGAVKDMTAHVEGDGLNPDAAIAKVASDQGLPKDWVPLLVQAHNHGRTTYQRERTGPALFDKLSEFPLASVEGVERILYPNEILSPVEEAEKTAVDAAYSEAPTWAARHYKAAEQKAVLDAPLEKRASIQNIPRDPDSVLTTKFGGISKLANAADEARRQVRETKMAYLASLGALANYFKGEGAAEFNKVAYWSEQLFGRVGKHAMEYVQARNKMKVGEVTAPPPDGQPVTKEAAPYSLVKAAADAGLAMVEAKKASVYAELQHKQAHDEVFSPFVQAPTEDHSLTSGNPSSSSKEAGLFSGAMGGLGFSASRALQGTAEQMPSGQTPDELSTSLLGQLSDPGHEQALQQVQVRSMLNDLMSNDEVVSGYDPDEVLSAYNEIASLSPRASLQPAIMRPLLRKRLAAGAVEPFEAQQMADIEKTIAQTNVSNKTAGVLNGNPILAAK